MTECDLCGETGRNTASQLWPDYPPACRACKGTGKADDPDQAWLDARDAEFDDRWNARMNP